MDNGIRFEAAYFSAHTSITLQLKREDERERKYSVGMASTSLSWTSSSWLQNHSFSKNTSADTTNGASVLTVVAQKKAKKTRKVFKYLHYMMWRTILLFWHQVMILFVFFNFFVCVSIQVILKEDVATLGKKGQLLDIKAGYYRNYLLPLGMAQIVTPTLLK